MSATQLATETAFDTAVETGASAARGEEVTWGTVAENAAGGVMGRGVAGRADQLYGERLRGLGHHGRNNRTNPSNTT